MVTNQDSHTIFSSEPDPNPTHSHMLYISPRGSHWSGPGSGSTVDFFKNIPDPRKKWSRFSGHSQEDFVNFQWTREIRDSEQARNTIHLFLWETIKRVKN